MTPKERADASPAQSDQFAKLGYRLDWRGFPTMTAGETVKFFEIFGDVVAVQETAGVVSVIEVRSGQTRWSDQVAGRLTKFVGMIRDDSQLLVSSESDVYFYDIATGNLKTRQHLGQVVNTRPVRVGDLLIYGCTNGQLLGHLTLNGFRAWGSGLTGSIQTDLIPLGSGRVAVGSTTGDFAIFDGQTGLSAGRARMYAGPGADLGASDAAVFVASTDQSLYAYSADGAAQLWRKRTDMPLKHAPVFHDGKLYCDLGPTAGGMTCLNPNTGAELWHTLRASGEVIGIRNKRLLTWDAATQIAMTLEATTGMVIDSVKLDNISILKPDEFADGHLFAVSPNGIVAKLSPR